MRSETRSVAAGRAHARAELSPEVAHGLDSFSNCYSLRVSVWALCMGIRLTCLIRGRDMVVLHSGGWDTRVGGGSDSFMSSLFLYTL